MLFDGLFEGLAEVGGVTLGVRIPLVKNKVPGIELLLAYHNTDLHLGADLSYSFGSCDGPGVPPTTGLVTFGLGNIGGRHVMNNTNRTTPLAAIAKYVRLSSTPQYALGSTTLPTSTIARLRKHSGASFVLLVKYDRCATFKNVSENSNCSSSNNSSGKGISGNVTTSTSCFPAPSPKMFQLETLVPMEAQIGEWVVQVLALSIRCKAGVLGATCSMCYRKYRRATCGMIVQYRRASFLAYSPMHIYYPQETPS
jgi:hypothetical protein